MVQTTVRPVLTVLRTARITMAAARASRPEVGSSRKSTMGLATSSKRVMESLRRIASKNVLVVCVIHQPRYEIFQMSDEVFLLAHGAVKYSGPTGAIGDFFAAKGLKVPAIGNPADFYMDAVQGAEVVHTAEVRARMESIADHRRLSATGSSDEFKSPAAASAATVGMPSPADTTDAGAAALSDASGAVEMVDLSAARPKELVADRVMVEAADAVKALVSRPLPSWPTLFYLELKRHVEVEISDLTPLTIDFILQCIPAIGMGLAAQGGEFFMPAMPDELAQACPDVVKHRCESSILPFQTIVIFAFFMTMVVGAVFATFGVQSFGKHWPVIMRERESGTPFWVAFLARNVYDLLHVSRNAFQFVGIFFAMASPHGSFGDWYSILWFMQFASLSLGYVVFSVVKFERATVVAVVTGVSMAVFSGLGPNLDVVRGWGPALALWSLSYNRWAAEAMIILTANNQNKFTPQHLIDRAISAAGYNPDNYSIALGVLVSIGVFYRLVALGFLMRKGSFAKRA